MDLKFPGRIIPFGQRKSGSTEQGGTSFTHHRGCEIDSTDLGDWQWGEAVEKHDEAEAVYYCNIYKRLIEWGTGIVVCLSWIFNIAFLAWRRFGRLFTMKNPERPRVYRDRATQSSIPLELHQGEGGNPNLITMDATRDIQPYRQDRGDCHEVARKETKPNETDSPPTFKCNENGSSSSQIGEKVKTRRRNPISESKYLKDRRDFSGLSSSVTQPQTNKDESETQRTESEKDLSSSYHQSTSSNETVKKHQRGHIKAISSRCKDYFVAPPPKGYFVRQNFSNDQSEKDQLTKRLNKEVPPCTFGRKSWCLKQNYIKGQDKEMAFRITLGESSFFTNQQLLCLDQKSKMPPKEQLKLKNWEKKTKVKERSLKIIGEEMRHNNKNVVPLLKKRDDKNNVHTRKIPTPLCYKKKILNPKSPKFGKTMGSLSLLGDSVLYYYEPQSDIRKKKKNKKKKKLDSLKKGTYVNNKNANSNLPSELVYEPSNDVDHIVSDITHFNVNANANGSDIDLAAKNKENQASTSCTSTVSGEAFFSTKTDILSTPEANESSENGSETDLAERNCAAMAFEDFDFTIEKECESKNDVVGLDLVVDDFIQSAIKQEEGERTLAQNMQDETKTKHKKKSSNKSESLTNKFEAGSPKPPRQAITKDEEKNRPLGKVFAVKLDSFKKCKKTKAAAFSSSSHENVKEDRFARAKHNINSPKSWETLNKLPSYTPLSQTQISVSSSQSPTLVQGPASKCNSPEIQPQTGRDNMNNIEYGDKPYAVNSENSEITKKHDLNEEHAHKKERGRSKKSNPEMSTVSILKKSRSNSCEAKGMQSQSNKHLTKRKSASALKKSISVSPSLSCKRKHRGSSGSRQSLRRAESKDSHVAKKTSSSKSLKKKTKKVRIIEEASGSPVEKQQIYQSHMEENKAIEEAMFTCSETIDKIESDSIVNIVPLTSETQNNEEEDDPGEEDLYSTLFGPIKSEEVSDQESSPSPIQVMNVKKTRINKPSKAKKCIKNEEDNHMAKAEQGWDNNFISQKAEIKAKAGPMKKRKRYQLKKSDKEPGEMNSPRAAGTNNEEADQASESETEKETTNDTETAAKKIAGKKEGANKGLTPTSLKPGKPTPGKNSYSPRLALRKIAKAPILKDPKEGSSVDAPAYNVNPKKNFSLRSTTSGPVYISKQNTKEAMDSAPVQRLKTVRENFAKLSRKNMHIPSPCKASPSPQRDEFSPFASYSTDLDVALGFKRQQSSPVRAMSSGRQARRESKSGRKSRSKSESEDWNNKPVGQRGEAWSRRLDNFTDPMDMNVLNLGLSWMVQGLMNRIPFFNPQAEDTSGASPVIVETHDN